MSYAPWVDKAYERNATERLATLSGVASGFADFGEKASKLAKAMADLKEFEKPSFLTHVHLVRMSDSEKGVVELLKFSSPIYAVKHTRLPLVMAISNKWEPMRASGKFVKFENADKEFGIKQILSWMKVVSAMNRSEKKELVKLLVDGIRVQKKGNYPIWLSDIIESGKEFEILGFAGNAPYLNVDKSYGDTKPIWVHPWGIPALVLRHREFPAMMITSPTIRLNENIKGDRSMEGYTG